MKIHTDWTLSFVHPETGETKTIPAQVPGNVIGDLERSGIIPDPFFSCNSDQLRPWEFIDWEYRTSFVPPEVKPGERLELHFAGVDTVFTVLVNGHEAGSGRNMFIGHRFDVTSLVKAGAKNELTVRIRSSLNAVRNIPLPPDAQALPYNFEGLALRRAMHTYGWDIAPRIVGAGLWREVTLEVIPQERWTSVYFVTQKLCPDGATEMGLHWSFATDRKTLDGFSIEIAMSCGEQTFTDRFPVHFTSGMHGFTLPDAQLWEPRGWGRANLYQVKLSLFHEEEKVASYAFRTGVRTVDLVRTPEPVPGERGKFQFVVNGRPIFIRGSNWVPSDALHGERPERVRKILDLFADLNCNMVRCWGGGVYEDDDFFDACDELGLLVWQDFMLGCERPLQTDEFAREMAEEAAGVITKLRHHPSIALWSGDNECDALLGWKGYLGKLPPSSNRITREVLPRAVRMFDPARDYLESSPFIHDLVWRDPKKYHCPEQHIWGPRDDFKGEFYKHHTAVFASEIGYHGMPSPESIRQFLPEADWNGRVGNSGWNCHAAQPFGDLKGSYSYRTQLMISQVLALFGTVPEELEPFAELSQIVQAEAFKFFIESFRIRYPERTGLIWWNVMDCWPQFSDAVVDYYFRKKLAYAYIRQSQQSVAMMFDEPASWNIRLYAVNDTLKDCLLEYNVTDLDTGKTVLSGRCLAKADASTLAAPLRMSCGEQKMYLIRWTGEDGVKGVNHYLQGAAPFAPEHYLKWLKKLQEEKAYQVTE